MIRRRQAFGPHVAALECPSQRTIPTQGLFEFLCGEVSPAQDEQQRYSETVGRIRYVCDEVRPHLPRGTCARPRIIHSLNHRPRPATASKQRANKQDAVHPAIVCEPRVDELRDAVVDDERVAVVREAGQDHLGL